MKNLLVPALIGVAILFSTMLIKVATINSKQMGADPMLGIKVDKHHAAITLSRLIQCKTISAQEKTNFDTAEFFAFHRILEESFPRIHSNLKKLVVSLAFFTPGNAGIIASNRYRFVPTRLRLEDLARLHGTDERINTDSLAEVIRVYIQSIRNSNKAQGIS